MKLPSKLTPTVSVGITGAGYYLPERVLTNADLEKMVDTSNEWIVERTGIKERRIAEDTVATSDMAIPAARSALERAGIGAEDLDMIICATITPDMQYPSTACLVQSALGARSCFAFDISAACTGFIYALATAYGFFTTNYVRNVLVIGAEKMTSITDFTDRNTCVLFGDGAGAVVLSRMDDDAHDRGIRDFIIESDGRHAEWLTLPAGGSRMPASEDTLKNRLHYTQMRGPEVFKFAVQAMKRTTVRIAERNNLLADDITWLIPHQANKRIIDAAAKAMGLSQDRIHFNIHKYGNMSAASTAVGLAEVVIHNNLQPGDHLVLVAFGAGMTWGSALIRW